MNAVGAKIDIKVDANVSEAVKQLQSMFELVQKLIDEINALNGIVDTDELNSALKVINDDLTKLTETANSMTSGKFSSIFSGLQKEIVGIIPGGNKLLGMLTQFGPQGALIVAGVGAAVKVIKELGKTYDEVTQKMKQLSSDGLQKVLDGFTGLITGSIPSMISGIDSIKDGVAELIDTVKDLSEAGEDLQSSLFTMSNYLGNDGALSINKFNTELGFYKGINIKELSSSLSGLFGAMSNMNLDNESLVRYTKNFEKFILDITKFTGSQMSDVTSQLEAALSFGVLNSRSSLAKALDLTDTMIKEFKKLSTVEERAQWILAQWPRFAGVYDKWMETDVGKVNILKNTWENLMGNIGTVALKVYAMVAPLLTNILNLANAVISGISGIFGFSVTGLSGASTGLESVADGIEDIGGALDKTSKKTASFDDVIQLADNIKAGGASNIGTEISDGVKLNSLLDQINDKTAKGIKLWEEYAEAVNKAIKAGDFKTAGKLVGDFFDKILGGIDFNKIKNKFKTGMSSIADFFNGLNSNKSLWSSAGGSISQIFNTITESAESFLKKFDEKLAGQALTGFINSMLIGINTGSIANSIYYVLNDIFTIAGELVNNNSIDLFYKKITNVITDGFKRIRESGNAGQWVTNTLGLASDIVGGLIHSIITVLQDPNTRQVVADAVSELLQSLETNASSIAESIIKLVNNVLGFITENIVTPENITRVINAIHNFANTLYENKDRITEYLKPIVQALSDGLEELIRNGDIDKILDAVWDIVNESGLGDLISKIMSLIIGVRIRNWWENFCIKAGAGMQSIVDLIDFNASEAVRIGEEWGATAREKIIEFKDWALLKINGAIDDVETAFDNFKIFFQGIVDWFGNRIDDIKNFFGGLADKVKEVFGSIGDFFSDLKKKFDEIKDWWGNSKVNPGNWSFDFKLPWMATGGIVQRATHAVIGEAGPEAVLPLSRNTEWMDILASKISRQGGGSNIPTVINVNVPLKSVYTRAELYEIGETVSKSLEVYGINIAVV